jgi:ADP-heptose:LPS heptosyltransferase
MQIVAVKSDIVMGELYDYKFLKAAQDINSPQEHELYVCCDALDKMQNDTVPCKTLLPQPKEFSLHDMDAIPESSTLLIVNGVGTGIGDALMGSIALRLLQEHFKQCGKTLMIDILTRENRFKAYSEIFRENPHVRKVYSAVMPFFEYSRYDYVIQNEGVITMNGMDRLNMVDFWINRLGMDHTLIPAADKYPQFYPNKQAAKQVEHFTHGLYTERPICLLNLFATDVRAIPVTKYHEFIAILQRMFTVGLIGPPEAWAVIQNLEAENQELLTVYPMCETLDHTYTLIDRIAALVVTPDTSIAHLAPCSETNTLCIFTTINPDMRIRYYPTAAAIWPYPWQKSSLVGNHHGGQDTTEYKLLWELFNVEHELGQVLSVERA